ncbi:MAG: sugar-binding transcriptional regulator [Clostridia bacterium]|nr:sugar-binding transcriptional regulator [Clostridia bacterium]
MDSLFNDMLSVQKKLVPEMVQILIRRYEILRAVATHEPIGRRNLSTLLGIGEKTVRNEISHLQEKLLLNVKNQGMTITEEGKELIENADQWIYYFKAMEDIEKELAHALNVKKVIISSTDSSNKSQIVQETARKTGLYLKSIISENMIIGITGGSTMAATVKEMQKYNCSKKDITVVPARGGLGEEVETQANNIAAGLAEKLNCAYKLLHITENLSKELLESLMAYPEIKETVDLIEKIDVLLFGIGRADVMATRRNLDQSKIDSLIKKGAVAEAFGYYFDNKGKIIDIVNTAGISLEQYHNVPHIIGAAAGVDKAEAIMAISQLNDNLVLVIDEGLANSILKIHKQKHNKS